MFSVFHFKTKKNLNSFGRIQFWESHLHKKSLFGCSTSLFSWCFLLMYNFGPITIKTNTFIILKYELVIILHDPYPSFHYIPKNKYASKPHTYHKTQKFCQNKHTRPNQSLFLSLLYDWLVLVWILFFQNSSTSPRWKKVKEMKPTFHN